MPDVSPDLTRAVFAKTPAGQQEIHSRSLGLGPLPRRLLVLVDGKRNAQELAAFVAGHDVNELLTQLIEKGCIEAIAAELMLSNKDGIERLPELQLQLLKVI